MSEKHDLHENDYKELRGAEGQAKIAELAKGIHICMMTTVNAHGALSSRPMAVQGKPFDGTMWFLTRSTSEKVDEIEQDQHVLLTFAEPSDSKYLSLKGRASVSNDRAKIKELWTPMYKAWFPSGEDDPQITVLKVEVSEGDYWEASSSKLVMMTKYLAAAVTGGKVAVGESGHVLV
jgi:general stress protein 26